MAFAIANGDGIGGRLIFLTYRNGLLEVPHLDRDVLPKIKPSIVALSQECRSANSRLILSTFAVGLNKLLGHPPAV